MVRVVLDTNILVAGLRSRMGASFRILQLVAQRRIRPVASVALFLEYEAVLMRDEHRGAHALSSSDVETFLTGLAAHVEPVEVHFIWRPQLQDPGDELVLEALVNGRCGLLLTHNLRDFAGVLAKWGARAVSPGQFLMETDR